MWFSDQSPPRLGARLFGHTLALVEAVAEVLAVLVGGVVCQHLLARGALEGLKARLALDGLRRGVLCLVSAACNMRRSLEVLVARTYGLQLTLGLLWSTIALAITLLLCPTTV